MSAKRSTKEGSREASKGSGPGTSNTVSRCPMCGKPTVKAHRPFCSKRCADLDLGRWLKGGYVVPGDPADEEFPDNPASWERD